MDALADLPPEWKYPRRGIISRSLQLRLDISEKMCVMIEHGAGVTKADPMARRDSYSKPPRCMPGARGDPGELLRAYRRTGDPDARERLVALYLPLVRALARRYAHCGELLDDLIQVGSIGLIDAIERFDPERGSDLRSFAIPTITGEIKNHLRDRASPVRVPRRVGELALSLRGPRARLAASLGRAPTLAELAREAGIDQSQVAEAIEAERARRLLPLSAADGGDEPGRSATVGDAYEASDDRLMLAAGFRTLAERERRILHLRFFAGLSQEEIAREVGLSQIQVSRLIRGSLERMRGALDHERLQGTGREPVVKR
jgi:RNA polymerase sigma-B factor